MIKVRVLDTWANIEPGFYSLRLGFALYNEFEFREIESGSIFKGIGDNRN